MKRKPILTVVLLVLLLTLCFAACACAAEIRPVPVDHDRVDLGNGEFCLTVRNADRISNSGFFIAALYLRDRYDAEQIRSLSAGDTVWVNDQAWTVREIIPHTDPSSPDTVTSFEVCPEEAFDGYLAFVPDTDGSFVAVVNDWIPVTPAGSVQVRLPLPDRFRYIPVVSGEEAEPLNAEAFTAALLEYGTSFSAYNTVGVWEQGMLVSVTHADYPECPEPDSSEGPVPVWKFCHGLRDGLDTAVITAYSTDCETGTAPAAFTSEEAEDIRRIAMNGMITEKANDTSVTGGTWIWSFETPGGKHLLSVEMYRGMIVGSDGMYRYR